jgi:cytochrome P450
VWARERCACGELPPVSLENRSPDPPVLGRSPLAALRMLRRDPITLLESAAALGDVVRIPLPRVTVWLVNEPSLVWSVLSTGNRDFRKSPTLQNARRVLGEGLLTSEGELHRRQRRLIQPIFDRGRIASYGPDMVREAERTADRLRPGEVVDVHAEMARLTLAIVGQTIFDADVEARDARDVADALEEVLSQFGRQFSPWLPITERLPIPSTRRFRRAVGAFDRTVYGLIRERRAAGDRGVDLLSLLLAAQEEGMGMSGEQVRDEAVTLFLAGHETTSAALTWTWWLLSQHHEAEARLHEELDRVLPDRSPTVADLDRLPYTGAVLSESMRLRPPAWAIGRQAVVDHELAGRTLPAGGVAVVSPWLLHHDPRWWPDPGEFRPERWLEGDVSRPRHAFIPFGGGARMCIGEGFAWMEARLLIGTVARHWRFELDPAARVELQPVITLRPRYGMAMRPVPRRARAQHPTTGSR